MSPLPPCDVDELVPAQLPGALHLLAPPSEEATEDGCELVELLPTSAEQPVQALELPPVEALELPPVEGPIWPVSPPVEVAAELVQPLLGEALWQQASTALAACSERRPIFIFDWDDTLFPTTALTAQGHFAAASVPPADRPQFEHLLQVLLHAFQGELEACARAGVSVLEAAKRSGHVLIVTNAIQGWVQQTAVRFLPGLLEVLKDVPVISARSIFEPQGFTDPARWKELCFMRIAKLANLGDATELGHFVSIGDSWHERAAALEVGQDAIAASYTKSLKLLNCPSITQVGQQLQVVAQWVEHLGTSCEHLDLAMQDGLYVAPLVLPHLASAAVIEVPQAVETGAVVEEAVDRREVCDDGEATAGGDVQMQFVLDAFEELGTDGDEVAIIEPVRRRCAISVDLDDDGDVICEEADARGGSLPETLSEVGGDSHVEEIGAKLGPQPKKVFVVRVPGARRRQRRRSSTEAKKLTNSSAVKSLRRQWRVAKAFWDLKSRAGAGVAARTWLLRNGRPRANW